MKIKKENTKEIADFLKVIAEENRLRILKVLYKEDICVCNLAKSLGLAQNLVSHHLKVLEGNNLLEKNRVGNQIFYKPLKAKSKQLRILEKIININ